MKESIEAEKELNASREKLGKSKVTVIIKDGRQFFAPHDQLRDKFHHARDLGSPIPKKLGKGELNRVSNPNLHQERLKTFRNREILPEAFVSMSGRRLRSHVLDVNTKVIEGTLFAKYIISSSDIPTIVLCLFVTAFVNMLKFRNYLIRLIL